MAVILSFTGNFGLRCSEALTLKREDIAMKADIPKIIVTGDTPGGKKSPGDVYVRKKHVHWLKSLLKNGYTVKREKGHKHGTIKSGSKKRKVIEVEDTYKVPESGFLFTSRKNAKNDHVHYHAVYSHVKKQAPLFLQHLRDNNKNWQQEYAKLRPHSGRATLITELMGEGLSTAMSMKFAWLGLTYCKSVFLFWKAWLTTKSSESCTEWGHCKPCVCTEIQTSHLQFSTTQTPYQMLFLRCVYSIGCQANWLGLHSAQKDPCSQRRCVEAVRQPLLYIGNYDKSLAV